MEKDNSKGTVRHKIEPDTPDEVCAQCSQSYQGLCRAFSVAHDREEKEHRGDGFGMECDNAALKKLRRKRYGIKYRT